MDPREGKEEGQRGRQVKHQNLSQYNDRKRAKDSTLGTRVDYAGPEVDDLADVLLRDVSERSVLPALPSLRLMKRELAVVLLGEVLSG